MHDRVLIANRGEIAVRIARTLRRLGIESVGVFSIEDRGARHVRAVDRALALQARNERSPYLDVEQIVALAGEAGADALHPGYGFLAERADAARACRTAGLTWIGPPPRAIELLGDKIRSKQVAAGTDVPTVPGLEGADVQLADVDAFGERAGYPLLLKAAAGGGGKGMRRVEGRDELDDAMAAARREAMAAFGRAELLVERLIEPARHIEVQVALDAHGHAYALGERECSLQRRHQKLIEESPSPAIDDARRQRLSEAAVRIATAARYRNLGTVEFLVDAADPDVFFFLEMNARLQVEHPVTEAVTGLDLVELQLRIAAGEAIDLEPVRLRGHAVEARVCAERVGAGGGFLPTTGRVLAYDEPDGVRVDSGIEQGSEVTTAFDSMLLKVIAHGSSREHALGKLERALGELTVLGVETNAAFLRELLRSARVRDGELTTTLVEELTLEVAGDDAAGKEAARAAAVVLYEELAARAGHRAFEAIDGWRQGPPAWARWRLVDRDGGELDVAARVATGGSALEVAVDGAASTVVDMRDDGGWHHARDGDWLWLASPSGTFAWREAGERASAAARFAGGLEAPLPGVVIAVRAAPGEAIEAGQPVVVIESMKMELDVTAPAAGIVSDVTVQVGEHVARGQVLALVDTESTP